MQKATDQDGADLLAAGTIPIEKSPIRKLMLGFLDPSEMTPEERMDELARILATGFLRLKGGQGETQERDPVSRKRSHGRITSGLAISGQPQSVP